MEVQWLPATVLLLTFFRISSFLTSRRRNHCLSQFHCWFSPRFLSSWCHHSHRSAEGRCPVDVEATEQPVVHLWPRWLFSDSDRWEKSNTITLLWTLMLWKLVFQTWGFVWTWSRNTPYADGFRYHHFWLSGWIFHVNHKQPCSGNNTACLCKQYDSLVAKWYFEWNCKMRTAEIKLSSYSIWNKLVQLNQRQLNQQCFTLQNYGF